MMIVRIIVNPAAGKGQGKTLALMLHDALSYRGAESKVTVTREAGHARAEAEIARTEVDVIVAVGGDGTANEVINGLLAPESKTRSRNAKAKEETVFAVFPAGTANALARELDLPTDPEIMADLVLSGTTVPVDVGRCVSLRHPEGWYFLQSAGAGLDAAVVHALHARRGSRISLLHYAGPVREVFSCQSMPRLRVTADGEVLCENAVYAVAGNCSCSAGIFRVTPCAASNSGKLDVAAFPEIHGISHAARLALASLRKGFERHPDIRYTQARHIVFEPLDPDVPLQLDGDPAGQLPAEIEVLPGALSVAAPSS